MTSAVTAPLERQFGQMSGLKQMSSQSSGGASVITLQFQLTLPLDVAEQEVQAAINAATNLLPSDSAQPAGLQQSEPGRSTDHDARCHLNRHADDAGGRYGGNPRRAENLADFRRRAGDTFRRAASGGTRKLNAQAIAALGLTSESVRTAITGANVNSAKGALTALLAQSRCQRMTRCNPPKSIAS